jgi:hypothetical protein
MSAPRDPYPGDSEGDARDRSEKPTTQHLRSDVEHVGASGLRAGLKAGLDAFAQADTPQPWWRTLTRYFITQGYCIEIVVRNLVQ